MAAATSACMPSCAIVCLFGWSPLSAHMANKMHAWSSLLLQDHLGRAEGYNIVHADKQFIVPTDGKPIRGLIQDHVVAGVEITCRWGPAAAEPHLFVVTRVLVVLGLLGPHATSCRSD